MTKKRAPSRESVFSPKSPVSQNSAHSQQGATANEPPTKKEGFALLVAGAASVELQPVVGSVSFFGGVERPAIHSVAPDLGHGEEDFFSIASPHRFGFGVGFFGDFSSDSDHFLCLSLFLL